MPNPTPPATACLVLTAALAGACVAAETVEPAAAPSPAFLHAMTLAPASCTPPVPRDATDLLPDGLAFVARLDARGALNGVFGPEIEAAISGAAGGREALTQLAACGLSPSSVSAITMGGDMAEKFVVVIDAVGIGSDATLDCLHDTLQKKGGASPWTRGTAACTTTLTPTGRDEVAYTLGADQIVLASKSMDRALRERLAGRGVAALDGHLKWARKSVQMNRTAWLAVDVPSPFEAGARGIDRLTASLDGAKGLDVQLRASFASRAAASEAATQLQMIPTMGPMLGVPSTVTDSVAIDQQGDTVTVEAFVSPSDLRVLQKLAGGAGR